MGAPWGAEFAKSMDVAYFTMYSGIKRPTGFVNLNIDDSGQVNSQQISQVLWDMYGKNWTKLWDDYTITYNPIENYNLKETVSRNQTDARDTEKNGKFSSSVNGTSEETYSSDTESSIQHGEAVNDTRTVNDFTYGFNSSTQVPTAVQTQSGTETHSGTDTTITSESGKSDGTTTQDSSGTTGETSTDTSNLNESIERNRSGNVGQNSYQELLTKDLELWKWSFVFQVFSDCDKFMTLSVF